MTGSLALVKESVGIHHTSLEHPHLKTNWPQGRGEREVCAMSQWRGLQQFQVTLNTYESSQATLAPSREQSQVVITYPLLVCWQVFRLHSTLFSTEEFCAASKLASSALSKYKWRPLNKYAVIRRTPLAPPPADSPDIKGNRQERECHL